MATPYFDYFFLLLVLDRLPGEAAFLLLLAFVFRFSVVFLLAVVFRLAAVPFRSGVTTVVDAGSSGWRNFPTFKARVIDHSQTRLLAKQHQHGLPRRRIP